MKLAPVTTCTECPFFQLYTTHVVECLLQEKDDCTVQIFYGHDTIDEALIQLASECPLIDVNDLLIYDCREIYDKLIKSIEATI